MSKPIEQKGFFMSGPAKHYDVAIIGGGIMGVSTAYYLSLIHI